VLWGLETSDITADWIVKACVVLHNFLIDESATNNPRGSYIFLPVNYLVSTDLFSDMADTGDEENGAWRQELNDQQLPQAMVRNPNSRQAKEESKKVREKFTQYYSHRGKVSWQDKMI
jgi:hypothetical protein